jgi:hypothetical protein
MIELWRFRAGAAASTVCPLFDRPFHVIEREADSMGRHEPVSQELVERDLFHPRLLRMEGKELHRLAQERSKRGDGSGYRLPRSFQL